MAIVQEDLRKFKRPNVETRDYGAQYVNAGGNGEPEKTEGPTTEEVVDEATTATPAPTPAEKKAAPKRGRTKKAK